MLKRITKLEGLILGFQRAKEQPKSDEAQLLAPMDGQDVEMADGNGPPTDEQVLAAHVKESMRKMGMDQQKPPEPSEIDWSIVLKDVSLLLHALSF